MLETQSYHKAERTRTTHPTNATARKIWNNNEHDKHGQESKRQHVTSIASTCSAPSPVGVCALAVATILCSLK